MIQVGLCALTAPTIGKLPLQIQGQLGLSGSDASVNASQFIVAGTGTDAFIVAILGIFVVAGEYSSGHIQSTLTVVPRRLPVLWAKSVVVASSVFLVAIISFVISYLPVFLVLLSNSIRISPFTIGAIAPLLGAAVYLALIAVFSLAVGVCLRSMAGGLAVVLGLLLLMPIILMSFQTAWSKQLFQFLPSAGMGIFEQASPTPWISAIVISCWVVLSLLAAAILLKGRDV